MPLPMVHLAVARRLLQAGFPVRDEGLFLLGALSPDAIHKRPGWTGADKAASHGVWVWEQVDDDAWKRYARAHRVRGGDFENGCFAHILTDIAWSRRIFRPLYAGFTALGLTRPAWKAIYYRETGDMDQRLWRETKDRAELAQKILRAPCPMDYPHLSAGEIAAWREEKLAELAAGEGRRTEAFRFLSPEAVRAFIDDAPALLPDLEEA